MLFENFNRMSQLLQETTISVLPDFYLDVIIDPKMPYHILIDQMNSVYSRGGGNIIGTNVKFVSGGNGGNVAKTVAGLGVKTSFITETSDLGRKLLEYFFEPLGIEILSSSTGDIASSVILEIPTEKQNKTNIMLSSAGSVKNFSYDKLTEDQIQKLYRSQIIAITNAQNLKLEQLVEGILENAPKDVFVSIDFSDLTPHRSRIDSFHHKILNHKRRPPQLIVGNENEFKILSKLKDIGKNSITQSGYHLSSDFPETYFALHTAKEVFLWKNGDLLAEEKCFNLDIKRSTGAGDAWHAGFLAGWQGGKLSYSESLIFANMVASFQLATGNIASLKNIKEFEEQYNI